MRTIRAAVLRQTGAPRPYATSKPLEIATVELAPPQRDEVMVQIRAAGLCHSDLSVIDGSRPRPLPMVLGHEAAGVVVETGPSVDHLQPGDHVVLVFVPSCGHCIPCAQGRPALCEPGAVANGNGTLLSGARRLQINGSAVNHHLGVSALADHAVVSKHSVVRIDRSIAFEEAALFGCAVLTGVGAVLNTAQVKAGSTVAVVGLGGVGLSCVLGARLSGARRIVAVDLNESKLALSTQLGATDAFDAKDAQAIAAIRAATDGGVDYAFEMAGSIAALEFAWAITRRGGHTITAGLPHPAHRLSIPAAQIAAEERTLRGSYLGGSVPGRDVPMYIDLYRRGLLPVEQLMTEEVALRNINAAFDRLAAGETTRQIVVLPDSQSRRRLISHGSS